MSLLSAQILTVVIISCTVIALVDTDLCVINYSQHVEEWRHIDVAERRLVARGHPVECYPVVLTDECWE